MRLCKLIFLLLAMPLSSFSQVPRSIHGTIFDTGGLPLGGVTVILEKLNDLTNQSFTTGSDGIYHFDCLADGKYSLTFKHEGFITERMEDFTYKHPQSHTFDKILYIDPAVYEKGMHIYGRVDGTDRGIEISVKDDQSACVDDAVIAASNNKGVLLKSSKTDVCGKATIWLAHGNRYSVRISKDGFKEQVINVDLGEKGTMLEIRLDPEK
jgi:hypothetical protein